MNLLKNTMAILEQMKGYNEWPSKVVYDRKHMMCSTVFITLKTLRHAELIETALDSHKDDLGVISSSISISGRPVERAGKTIYVIKVHQKGDSMMIGRIA